MDDTPKEELKFEIFDPETILAFILAGLADLFFWTIIVHYVLAIPFYFLTIPRMRHFSPKLFLWIGILTPSPTLVLMFILAIIAEKNALARFAEEQAAIIGVGIVTGGLGAVGGEIAEGAAVAGGAAEAAGAVAEAGGEAAARGAGAAGKEAAKKAGKRAAGRFIEEGERREQEKQQEERAESEEQELARAREFGETPPFFPEYKEELFGTPTNGNTQSGDVIMGEDGTVDLREKGEGKKSA